MNDNKKFWNRFSRLYTPLQEKSNKKIYDEIINLSDKYLSNDKSMLELACGTGQFTFSFCKKCKSYIATDLSENMVDETKKRSEKILTMEERENISFSVEDAISLPYEDNSFDIVLIANAFHIMPEPLKALQEIKRVLKKEGILIAPTFIYEGKVNRLRLWFIERAGFKTFYKWDKKGCEDFIKGEFSTILESKIIQGDLLPELFIVSKK